MDKEMLEKIKKNGTLHDYHEALKTYMAEQIIESSQAKRVCGCGSCTAEYQHKSDCVVHNEPAMPKGECDCMEL